MSSELRSDLRNFDFVVRRGTDDVLLLVELLAFTLFCYIYCSLYLCARAEECSYNYNYYCCYCYCYDTVAFVVGKEDEDLFSNKAQEEEWNICHCVKSATGLLDKDVTLLQDELPDRDCNEL